MRDEGWWKCRLAASPQPIMFTPCLQFFDLDIGMRQDERRRQIIPAESRIRRLSIEACPANEGTKARASLSDLCRASSAVRRRRTPKRDEHCARFFLDLPLVPTKNENRDLEARPTFAKRSRRRSSAARPRCRTDSLTRYTRSLAVVEF